MSTPYLTRVRLRRDVSAGALAPLLLPEDGAQAAAGHHLIWSLFADDPERRRDFLWRTLDREGNAGFLVLSERRPEDRHGLFDVETKSFDVQLRPGDRLQFSLRANPVVARRVGPRRSVRADVVMDHLRAVAPGERAAARPDAVATAGRDWIARQLDGAGAGLVAPDESLRIDGYTQTEVPRGKGRQPARFSVLDFDGLLDVRDPERFLVAVRLGFGKAKAFGCGLMLLRRA